MPELEVFKHLYYGAFFFGMAVGAVVAGVVILLGLEWNSRKRGG